MKTKVSLIILVVIAISLGIGMISLNKKAAEQHQEDVGKILSLSNQWTEANTKWQDEQQAHLALQKDYVTRKAEIAKLSNDLTQTSDTLTKTEAALKTSQEENAKRDAQISKLENKNEELDKQAGDLKTSISNLEGQIADTQKKLDASEGDKQFLEKELKRLMAEKADLERRFNDLAVLRAQVHKLKDELSISRRLEWIREGLFARDEEKGAQKLMQGALAGLPKRATTNNYDLSVEVNADGSVKVIDSITNNPTASAQTPPKQ